MFSLVKKEAIMFPLVKKEAILFFITYNFLHKALCFVLYMLVLIIVHGANPSPMVGTLKRSDYQRLT